MILLYFQGRRCDESKDASIFGAELKNEKELCVNYFKRRDLYEKKIIFINLNSQKCFLIYKSMPVWFVFPTSANEQVFVTVTSEEIAIRNKKCIKCCVYVFYLY